MQGTVIPIIISNVEKNRYYFKSDSDNLITEPEFSNIQRRSILKAFMTLHKAGWAHGDPYVSEIMNLYHLK